MRLFGSPHRYYQGPGVFDDLGAILAPLGPHPLVVVDAFMLGVLGPRLEASLAKAGVRATIRSFGGEITYRAIDALIAGLGGAVPAKLARGDGAHHCLQRQPDLGRHRHVRRGTCDDRG
jgi:glycerol dehydrogenase